MNNICKAIIGGVFGAVLLVSAANAQCTVTYTFTNGTTADANQVNTNFSNLTSCVAPIASPAFTGNVGIGISPSIYFPLIVGTSGTNIADFDSTDVSGGAISVSNSGSANIYMGSAGALVTGGSVSDGAIRASLGNLVFAIGANEAGRFDTSGNLYVGMTSGGSGLVNINGSMAVFGAASANETGAFFMDVSGGVGRLYKNGINNSTIGQIQWQVVTANGSTSYVLLQNDTSGNLYPGVDNTFSFGKSGLRWSAIWAANGTIQTSDARRKTVLDKQRDFASIIKNVWVGDVKWNNNEKPAPNMVVLAQQTNQFFPDAVMKAPIDHPDQDWGVNYAELAPLALWGVKDLYKETTVQKSDLDTLRQNERTLEKTVSLLQQANENLQQANDNEKAEVQELRTQMSALQRKVRFQTAEK